MQTAKRPGLVRWSIVAMLFAITVINYADRASLSLAAKPLSADLHIDKIQLGYIMSGFGWAYAFAQIPGGWLLDRFGTTRVYLGSILLWSVFTALQGTVVWMSGMVAIVSLFAFRFLMGLAEAPSFPGNSRMVASWFPAKERGTAAAIFNSAQYFATVIFAPIMGWIIGSYGWPWVFAFMGVCGVLGAMAWTRTMFEPREHPRLQPAELELIREGGALVDTQSAPAAEVAGVSTTEKLKVLLGTPTLLGLYLSQFFINTLTYFFITWFPVYLMEERGLSAIKAGLFATVPALCGFVGGVLGGILSDWLLHRGTSLTVARKVPVVGGMLLSLAILGCVTAQDNVTILIFMSLAFFGKGIGALGWAVMTDVAPRKYAGLSAGIFNMFGNLSSIVTPIVIGYILYWTGSFDLVLALVAASALCAALCYLFLVGTIRRIGEDETVSAATA